MWFTLWDRRIFSLCWSVGIKKESRRIRSTEKLLFLWVQQYEARESIGVLVVNSALQLEIGNFLMLSLTLFIIYAHWRLCFKDVLPSQLSLFPLALTNVLFGVEKHCSVWRSTNCDWVATETSGSALQCGAMAGSTSVLLVICYRHHLSKHYHVVSSNNFARFPNHVRWVPCMYISKVHTPDPLVRLLQILQNMKSFSWCQLRIWSIVQFSLFKTFNGVNCLV